MIRRLVDSQIWLSKKFDTLLPERFRVDGNKDFVNTFVPGSVASSMRVYDVGGGKNPYFSRADKEGLALYVVGIDIDQCELDAAPKGSYDQTISADISNYAGGSDGDVVLCQALLEHVADVSSAFKSISSLLKPGGRLLIFVPSRNALFARLNILLPQEFKKYILHTIYPNSRRDQGFASFYDRCTPRDFVEMGSQNRLQVVRSRYYFVSSYFSFFFPLYFLWRIWILVFEKIAGNQAAETFSIEFVKQDQ